MGRGAHRSAHVPHRMRPWQDGMRTAARPGTACPPAATEQLLRARPLRSRTTRAPVDVDDLMRQLEDIRRTGVSFDHGETVQDVGCAATGIRGPHGEVIASLSISAPMRRFTQHEPQLVVAVRGAAVQVAERLRASEHPAGWRDRM
ncbi:IclR family transcriptional regulator C-terminal domain-containing protein [Streptomyces sp900116325]|uniref:IclR family transcriptional regulator domain-containing protein n=1 Tax=Streptomyces sp. 900116325 TaxID=3154295 RepID=UPI00339E3ACA